MYVVYNLYRFYIWNFSDFCQKLVITCSKWQVGNNGHEVTAGAVGIRDADKLHVVRFSIALLCSSKGTLNIPPPRRFFSTISWPETLDSSSLAHRVHI